MKLRLALTALLFFSVALMTGCGGGGSDGAASAPPPPAPSPITPPPGAGSGACPSVSLNDAWLDKRVGCLVVGQSVIDIAASATGTTSSYSFVVRQRVLDSSFTNVLGADRGRFFSRILCVRNAPSGLTDSFNRLSLATDLVVAIRAAGSFPSGYSTFMTIEGGNQAGFVQEECDPTRHPIIIDFSTRQIESINSAAIASVSIYDL